VAVYRVGQNSISCCTVIDILKTAQQSYLKLLPPDVQMSDFKAKMHHIRFRLRHSSERPLPTPQTSHLDFMGLLLTGVEKKGEERDG